MKILKTANFEKRAGPLMSMVISVVEEIKKRIRVGEEIDSAINTVVEEYKAKAPQKGEAWDRIVPLIRRLVEAG